MLQIPGVILNNVFFLNFTLPKNNSYNKKELEFIRRINVLDFMKTIVIDLANKITKWDLSKWENHSDQAALKQTIWHGE